ncbi:MAG TPA: PAS domain S-box protein, partial [Isosphaeraceae bacterium]
LPAGAGADTPPGVLFHCAVVVGAWLGGLGPGLLATALSGGLIASGSVEPIGSPRIAHPGLGLRLGEFLAEGSLVSLLMARLRDSRRRAELGAEEACRRREALRRSEERARLLIEDVRDYAIFRLDAGGRIASWNAGAEAVTGYAAGAILGRHVSALDTPEAVARGESRRDLREAEATGRFQGEGWRVRQDGSRFWAHLSITALPTEAGSARGFSVVAHDISRRRADEEALRRDRDELEGRVLERTAELAAANRALREEMDQHRRTEQDLRACRWRYGVLADTVPQIVWSAGPDGRPGDFNRLWFAYTGLTPREGLGPEGWLRAVHPDDVPYCTRRLAEAIGAGAPYELEFRLRRAADGAYRWHLGRAQPLRDDQGRVVQWFGTCTDIDDHKRDAEDPRRSRAELEDRVRRRMADLEDVNAALRGRASILQSILDAMADGVLVADRDGRFLAFNPAAERIFGHGATAGSAAEWPGRCGLYRPDRVTPLPVEEMPLIRAARGESLGDQEIFVRHARAPEGLWILARGRPLPGEDGTPAGGVVVCHDVTGRKRAEEALRASEAK